VIEVCKASNQAIVPLTLRCAIPIESWASAMLYDEVLNLLIARALLSVVLSVSAQTGATTKTDSEQQKDGKGSQRPAVGLVALGRQKRVVVCVVQQSVVDCDGDGVLGVPLGVGGRVDLGKGVVVGDAKDCGVADGGDCGVVDEGDVERLCLRFVGVDGDCEVLGDGVVVRGGVRGGLAVASVDLCNVGRDEGACIVVQAAQSLCVARTDDLSLRQRQRGETRACEQRSRAREGERAGRPCPAMTTRRAERHREQ
jgi:hypothetical protein